MIFLTKYKAAIYAAVVAAVLAAGFVWHTKEKENAVTTAVTALKAEYQRELLESIQRSQKIEMQLKADSEQLVKQKNNEIRSINRELDNALTRLQYRPTRAEQHSLPPSDSGACTGRELPREDGEFLAREAAAAQKLVTERDYYYREYENARIRLDELRKANE